jgi:hypothetical protein
MSRPKTPANDHLAAFKPAGDDLDRLTDAEIEARLATTGETLMREIKLRILRSRERSLARLAASALKDLP